MALANVTEIFDQRRISAYQKLIFFLCGTIVFVEGFNAQLPGYVVPALSEAWKLTAADRTWFIFSGLAGLALGGLFIAPLADKYGRRPVLLACVALFGICSLAAAASPNTAMLDIARFLTGLGLGGGMPNAIAVTAEYSPTRRRHAMVAMIMSGFIMGSIVVGLVSASLITAWGWQSVLVTGGVLSLLLALVLALLLPESIRFLVVTGGSMKTIAATLARIDPTIGITPDTRFVIDGGAKASIASLFSDGRARVTVLIWIVYFMSLLNVYFLASWLPTHVHSLGVTVVMAILIGTMLQVGGLFGVSLGFLLDLAGPSATIFTAYFIGAVSIAVIGFAGPNVVLLTLAVFGAGFGIIGGQNSVNAYASGIYPTQIRSTGIGWATGVGRVGSIVGPTIGGILLQMNMSSSHLFFLAVIPALCASAAGIGLSSARALRPKTA